MTREIDPEHVCHAIVSLDGRPVDLWCAEHYPDRQDPLTDRQRAELAKLLR